MYDYVRGYTKTITRRATARKDPMHLYILCRDLGNLKRLYPQTNSDNESGFTRMTITKRHY